MSRTPPLVFLAVLTLLAVAAPAGAATALFQTFASLDCGASPRGIALADLNGDGRPDLAIADISTDGVAVLLALASGGFQRASDVPTGTSPQAIVAGDVNGDGKVDLLVAN